MLNNKHFLDHFISNQPTQQNFNRTKNYNRDTSKCVVRGNKKAIWYK